MNRRPVIWGLVLLGAVALVAAIISFRLESRAILEERRLRRETRREIAAQPFVRAKVDSGYKLVAGRGCGPFDPHAEEGIEFCLEKKAKPEGLLEYTFERYVYDSRDSGACRVRPVLESRQECLP